MCIYLAFMIINYPIITTVSHQEFDGQIICVTWDFEQEDWISDGCITSNITQDGIVTCSCNHLTNFAVLVVHK